jgi:hypothetical protein
MSELYISPGGHGMDNSAGSLYNRSRGRTRVPEFSVKTLDLQERKISDFHTCWCIRKVGFRGNHPSPRI